LRLVGEIAGDAHADEQDRVEERQLVALVHVAELFVQVPAAEHLVEGGVPVRS